jgi:hypothetical protein
MIKTATCKVSTAFAIAATLALTGLALTGCSSDADVASENLSRAAEQFEIERRVVFFNGITDTYLLVIEGRCSIEDSGNQLEVTCKTGENEYLKHFLGLSDNVSYFVEQTAAADLDVYHYRVIFKPETIVPYVDMETSVDVETND